MPYRTNNGEMLNGNDIEMQELVLHEERAPELDASVSQVNHRRIDETAMNGDTVLSESLLQDCEKQEDLEVKKAPKSVTLKNIFGIIIIIIVIIVWLVVLIWPTVKHLEPKDNINFKDGLHIFHNYHVE